MPRRLIPAILILSAALGAYAVEPVNKSRIGGLAIKGYDPVAYFTDKRAVKGSGKHEHYWMNATWRFASAANRTAFVKDPAKYAPQYGGYCAFGVSRGYAVGVDPEAWTVVDDKLYLNYSMGVRDEWMKDTAGHIRKADTNWPTILKE